jgi:LPXTG-site transpeptidase (sortase) family protein
MISRIYHFFGLLICTTGLGLILFLATSRFYSPPQAKPSQTYSAASPLVDQENPLRSFVELSGIDFTRQLATKPEVLKIDAPPFSVPQPDPNESNDLTPLNSTSISKNISPAKPIENRNEITRLVIPDLRLDAPIKFIPLKENSWELDDLGLSVAWLGNTTDDHTIRNLVLAGHVTVRDGSHGPFRYLSRLTPGAHLFVYSERYIYTYQVRELYLVYPQDAYITDNTTESQLTLITCATWNEKTKTYLRRQVVIADLLKVAPYPKNIVN